MPVLLISKEERCVWTYGDTDAKIYYRRVSREKGRELEAQHTKKGVMDRAGLVDSILKYAILDWSGFADSKTGQEVPYSEAALGNVPDTVLAEFVNAIYLATPETDSLKN